MLVITQDDQHDNRPDGYAVDIVIYPLYAGVDADGDTTLLRGEEIVRRITQVSRVSGGVDIATDRAYWKRLCESVALMLESALAALLKRRAG